MQASLEAEAKGKAEILRMKKKLEGDINGLEIALDRANKVMNAIWDLFVYRFSIPAVHCVFWLKNGLIILG